MRSRLILLLIIGCIIQYTYSQKKNVADAKELQPIFLRNKGTAYLEPPEDYALIKALIEHKTFLHQYFRQKFTQVKIINTDDQRHIEILDSTLRVLDTVKGFSSMQKFYFFELLRIFRMGSESVFLQDSILLKIVVKCLASKDATLVEHATNILISQAHPVLLTRFSTEIKETLFPLLTEYGYSDNIKLLLSIVDLSDKEKNVLRLYKNLPDICKVRIGDIELKKKLIDDFLKSTDYNSKASLASALGFFGTEEAAKALFTEFNSPVTHFDTLYGHGGDIIAQTSIRLPIIKALARIYPDNLLFSQNVFLKIEDSDELTHFYVTLCDTCSMVEKLMRVKERPGSSADLRPLLDKLNAMVDFANNRFNLTVKKNFTFPYIKNKIKM